LIDARLSTPCRWWGGFDAIWRAFATPMSRLEDGLGGMGNLRSKC
jgi:hypothetical protein